MKNKTTFSIHRGLIAFFFGILFCFAPLSGQTYKIQLLHILIYWKKSHRRNSIYIWTSLFNGAGEKIWFKGYLVNSVTHQDNTQSNFIITELVNRSDSIVERKKIRRDSLGFHNAFTLLPLSLQVIIICGDIATGCLIRNRNSFIHAI